MRPLSFKRHRFPAEVIHHAVWLYFRFTLSFGMCEFALTTPLARLFPEGSGFLRT
jgi:transposase-like protein